MYEMYEYSHELMVVQVARLHVPGYVIIVRNISSELR